MTVRFSNTAIIVLTALLCFSCDTSKPAPDAAVDLRPGTAGRQTGAMPDVPKDAQFTIVCRSFTEDTHVQDARQAQQILFDSTRLKKWYVVHASDHSTLYHGFYRSINPHDSADATEGKRAIDDLNTIRTMQDSQGSRLFPEALLIGIDAPDPQANPGWDITRTDGTWSIEIATFTNSANRKERAVQAVRDFRNSGEKDIYYYHGPTASSVCVGSWPQEAAIEQGVGASPDADGLVVTNAPLPETYNQELRKKNIATAAPHVDVIDPTLTQALSKWKEHSVNGYTLERKVIDPVTHQETTEPERPFLFRIPHKDPLESPGNNEDTVSAPTLNTGPVEQPGLGHLRSLGD